MIAVAWVAPEEEWFTCWLSRALAETNRAIKAKTAGEAYEFSAAIWTELKAYLFGLFNGKCAYCESDIRHVMPGDVEHYRPKSKVTGCPLHPGYYWLAYVPTNLLPSCELCNRAGGKMNLFPVEDDLRMSSPTDSTVERPLLLNPYFDRPEDHLQFTPAVNGMLVGTIAAKTSRGEASIRICRLDRKELDSARRLAQENTLNSIKIAILRNDSASSEFQRLESGTSPFSAACLSAADTWISRLR